MLAFRHLSLLMPSIFLTIVTSGLSVGGKLPPSSVDPEFQRVLQTLIIDWIPELWFCSFYTSTIAEKLWMYMQY